MYGVEVTTMTKEDGENLKIKERKMLETILGPVKIAENECRVRRNQEI